MLIRLLCFFLIVYSAVYANTDVHLHFNPEDKAIFENTHVCLNCNLADVVSGFQKSSPLPSYEGSILTGSLLSYSTFGCTGSWANSNFKNTILIKANFNYLSCSMMLDGSSFIHANLQEAKLLNIPANHVDFTDADLSNAELNGSHFSYSDFTNAKLNGAILYAADFCGAKITEEQIKSSANYACAMKADCSGRYPHPDGKPCIP